MTCLIRGHLPIAPDPWIRFSDDAGDLGQFYLCRRCGSFFWKKADIYAPTLENAYRFLVHDCTDQFNYLLDKIIKKHPEKVRPELPSAMLNVCIKKRQDHALYRLLTTTTVFAQSSYIHFLKQIFNKVDDKGVSLRESINWLALQSGRSYLSLDKSSLSMLLDLVDDLEIKRNIIAQLVAEELSGNTDDNASDNTIMHVAPVSSSGLSLSPVAAKNQSSLIGTAIGSSSYFDVNVVGRGVSIKFSSQDQT